MDTAESMGARETTVPEERSAAVRRDGEPLTSEAKRRRQTESETGTEVSQMDAGERPPSPTREDEEEPPPLGEDPAGQEIPTAAITGREGGVHENSESIKRFEEILREEARGMLTGYLRDGTEYLAAKEGASAAAVAAAAPAVAAAAPTVAAAASAVAAAAPAVAAAASAVAAVAAAEVVIASAIAANAAAAAAAGDTVASATAALRQKSKVAAGERRSSARALILAMRRDSDRDVLRSPDPAVSELEISWAAAEREEPEWKEKELQEVEEELKSDNEPEGQVEEQEGEPTPLPWSCLFCNLCNPPLRGICIGCLEPRKWSIHRRSPQVDLIAEFCLIFILMKISANFVYYYTS
jgi:hypothetical protein